MGNNRFSIPFNSIRVKIFLPIVLTLVPLFCLLFYYNYYVVKVVQDQVAESSNNMLSITMNNLDNHLQILQIYLSDIASMNKDIMTLESDSNESEKIYAEMRVQNTLLADISMFNPISSIFIFEPDTNKFISAYGKTTNYTDSQSLSDYFTNNIDDESVSHDLTDWRVNKIGDYYYLCRIINISNFYVGACIKINDLILQTYYPSKTKNVTLLILDENSMPTSAADIIEENNIDLTGNSSDYNISGNPNSYLVLSKPSVQGEFSIVALIPNKAILEHIPFIQIIIYIIITVLLIALALNVLYLRRIVVYPLNKLMKTMKAIREGNIDTRVPPIKTTDEFHLVNDTFNNMMDQIKQLKIDVYEEQVMQHKEELRRLQLEINPHFFLNSLNIIYSYTETYDYELIKEMTLCLIKYFRYIFYSNTNCVTLKDELTHVQNYLRIQQLRYPKSFQYVIDVPETLYDSLVPTLILQTFVENTNKYALSLDSFIILTIRISQETIDDEKFLKILIKDNGKHIEADILEQINAGKTIIDKYGGIHTGITNIKNRLRLLYGEKGTIKVKNMDTKGVSVEIIIPVNMKREEIAD